MAISPISVGGTLTGLPSREILNPQALCLGCSWPASPRVCSGEVFITLFTVVLFVPPICLEVRPASSPYFWDLIPQGSGPQSSSAPIQSSNCKRPLKSSRRYLWISSGLNGAALLSHLSISPVVLTSLIGSFGERLLSAQETEIIGGPISHSLYGDHRRQISVKFTH